MFTLTTLIAILIFTPILGTLAIIHALLGGEATADNFLGRAPRIWSQLLLRAAGVRVELHNAERMEGAGPHIFVANHVSWFDVLALAANLPHYSFVAKAELAKIPIFGKGARAVGTIWIERDNRKAAFDSYKEAAQQIKRGANVVVYPEGTRGTGYALRPFKKGPFVLAVAAQAPIVPTLIHGTIEILPRGSFNVRPGTIHVHFLEPISTEGCGYEDRNALAQRVRDRMSSAQQQLYGVETPALKGKSESGSESESESESEGESESESESESG